ncbi:MAG: tetratricopeptide repeat protein [Candidatus Kapabacteria bacterium]|nr:tetratricopeptide repeat protein [Candidatus Kapabacteria bacterium]
MSSLNSIKLLAVILFLFIGPSVHCCINEYRTLLNGEVVFTDGGNVAPIGRFNANDKPYLLKKLHESDSIYRLTGKLEDYSDLGSMLVYTGQYFKAKQIFQEIEQKSPGLYQTAANLGTTYELLGQNDSALYWIKRAVEINPNSHSGSEWIHVKILEAKVKANGDEKYLWTHSILSLDFGDDKIPVNKNNLDLQNLREHLYNQLNERMSFIKSKDPIVAQLLFDLGNVCALARDATSGLQVYKSAKEYGYASDLFDKRLSYFEKLQFKADFRNNTERWAKNNPTFVLVIVGTIFVSGLWGIIFLFRRIKKRLHKKKSTNR